ncbi:MULTISPECIES: VWA domain-containing protein [unclassified Microbacterium]|uniref:VWA domain-containing protein n=1 Tax=unclassified Microbacterium TaxID=2609290 RepID=UPI001605014E|nr:MULTISPECIES: VWA domain-containing protein [unclassified Microbacterium]QNA91292.1 VWA domain-containing protein [Microbacterium sp. Se63.02b]QYM64443.1 VWA domain-containing protein [Microbacterium sp. Se5.02b]
MIFQPVLNPLLIALLCLPVAALVIWIIVRPSASTGITVSDSRTRAGHRALWVMRLVLVLACATMLLRPGIPGGATQTLATDTDIVLVVDTTASIVAEDWADDEPRLDGIREDVRALVEEYPGARFALITSDAAAELRMPLTTDTTALMGSLDVLRPEVTSQSRGSSIGVAAPLLSETLASAASSSPDRSRMVFYFGDGEQTVESEPESFSASAEYTDAGAVFGYGTVEGGPMRITTGGLSDDGADYIQYEGSDALSVIDETNLEAIGEQLGVDYQHRTADAAPVLPEAPSTTTNYAESGEVGNVTELYWIAALVALLILGVEVARATVLIVQLRGLRAPRHPGR